MKNLGTNEWTILNNIIYKIYTTEHFDEMRLVLLEELRVLIDFDSADFYVAAEHDEKKLAHPVKLDMECDFAQEYEQLDASRGSNQITGIILCRWSLRKIIIFLA